MKEFIEYVTRQLVDLPDEVCIEEIFVDNTVTFKVKVAQSDIGKIIGKRGRTAYALRTLATAVGKKAGKTVLLEVVA